MNAIARTLPQETFINRPIFAALSAPKLRVFIFCAVVMLTALGLLYVKDLNRRLFINYQDLRQTNINLNVDHSKLLLEESALSAQARVQRIAQQGLGMEVPATANVKVVTL